MAQSGHAYALHMSAFEGKADAMQTSRVKIFRFYNSEKRL